MTYLISLMTPFARYTTALSKTHGPTLHMILKTYKSVFNHLNKELDHLQQMSDPQLEPLISRLKQVMQKLQKYYAGMTNIYGYYYALGTMLSPQYKLKLFGGKSWLEDDFIWRDRYLDYLKEKYTEYSRTPMQQMPTTTNSTCRDLGLKLDIMLDKDDDKEQSTSSDEIHVYMEQGTIPQPFC